jgi:hypothetical protein
MELDIFEHSPGRLAIRPIVKPGENWGMMIRVLAKVPCRRWHPKERLWTISDQGPAVRHLCALLVALQASSPHEHCLTLHEEAM